MRALLALALLAAPLQAKTVPALLGEKPVAELASTKTAAGLEPCLGTNSFEWYVAPIVLRGDGEVLVSVTAADNAVMAFRVVDQRSRRIVTVHGSGPWQGRAIRVAKACV